MTPLSGASPGKRRIRRSERVTAYLPVSVRGVEDGGQSFEEETRTIVISPYGAKITLRARVQTKGKIALTNLGTQQELECRVVRIERKPGGRSEVALEFSLPAPQFWSNWNSKSRQG